MNERQLRTLRLLHEQLEELRTAQQRLLMVKCELEDAYAGQEYPDWSRDLHSYSGRVEESLQDTSSMAHHLMREAYPITHRTSPLAEDESDSEESAFDSGIDSPEGDPVAELEGFTPEDIIQPGIRSGKLRVGEPFSVGQDIPSPDPDHRP